MPLTSDDLISMHKACEQVLEDMQLIDRFPHGNPDLIDAQIGKLRGSIQALATIQRDLLKGLLGG